MGSVLALLGQAAVDTVVSVTLPVAAALFLYEWGALSGVLDAPRLLRRAGRWRPVLAAALAAIPGCAGSIAVSRLFVDGVVDRASLLAAHLATSGDASFVLLIGRPLVALALFAFAFCLAAVVGMVAFPLTAKSAPPPAAPDAAGGAETPAPGEAATYGLRAFTYGWYFLVALTGALDLTRRFTAVAAVLALAASIAVLRWRPAGEERPRGRKAVLASAAMLGAKDAAEITLWVAIADAAYALASHYGEAQLHSLLTGGVLGVALLAALLGAVPGCGVQIFLARLFTAGQLPLAAIVANTAGQHGDAIFPLLARDRKATAWVTVIQAAVALAVAVVAVRLLRG